MIPPNNQQNVNPSNQGNSNSSSNNSGQITSSTTSTTINSGSTSNTSRDSNCLKVESNKCTKCSNRYFVSLDGICIPVNPLCDNYN